MKNIIFTLAFISLIAQGTAQNYGEIHGRVLDKETKTPIPFATISADYGGRLTGTVSDDEGRFRLKPLQPSTYVIKISFVGYESRTLSEIHVASNKITALGEIYLSINNDLPQIEIVGHKLIDADNPNVITMKDGQIKHNALLSNPARLVGSLTSELTTTEAGEFIVRGGRPGTSATYVDGVRLTNGLNNLPGSAIRSISIYTGGIPAKYGDITGGVVIIETKSYFDYYNDYIAELNR